jgi:hypothetical protein
MNGTVVLTSRCILFSATTTLNALSDPIETSSLNVLQFDGGDLPLGCLLTTAVASEIVNFATHLFS